jgi:MYXO-CTERM domain-containing protein
MGDGNGGNDSGEDGTIGQEDSGATEDSSSGAMGGDGGTGNGGYMEGGGCSCSTAPGAGTWGPGFIAGLGTALSAMLRRRRR